MFGLVGQKPPASAVLQTRCEPSRRWRASPRPSANARRTLGSSTSRIRPASLRNTCSTIPRQAIGLCNLPIGSQERIAKLSASPWSRCGSKPSRSTTAARSRRFMSAAKTSCRLFWSPKRSTGPPQRTNGCKITADHRGPRRDSNDYLQYFFYRERKLKNFWRPNSRAAKPARRLKRGCFLLCRSAQRVLAAHACRARRASVLRSGGRADRLSCGRNPSPSRDRRAKSGRSGLFKRSQRH